MTRVVQVGGRAAYINARLAGVVDTIDRRVNVLKLDERLPLLGHEDDLNDVAVLLERIIDIVLAHVLDKISGVHHKAWRLLLKLVAALLFLIQKEK